MQNGWADQEICEAKLWDPRCYYTLTAAVEKLAENAQASFSRVLGSQRKAVSRILHHKSVTPQDLLRGHVRATKRRVQQHPFVLVTSDTTSMDFTSHEATQGMGALENKHARGFLAHSALALTPQGCPLGLLYQHAWVRQEDPDAGAKARRKRLFEDKESYKWLQALRGVEKALPEGVRALLIQDREADVFEFFSAQRRPGIDLLIRLAHSRGLEVDKQAEFTLSLEALAQARVVAHMSVAVPARGKEPARQATVQVRTATLCLRAPLHRKGPKLEPVTVQLIGAYEVDAPASVKEALQWLLLTTLSIPDAQTGVRMIGYYALRWRVERFHYVLKSGCNFEKLQLDRFDVLNKALRLYSIVAWRLLQVTYLAREFPDAAVSEVFSVTEHRLLEQATGRSLPTVGSALLAVARLGGFRPVPSAPDPGVKSLWLGFRKLSDMLLGYQLARSRPLPH